MSKQNNGEIQPIKLGDITKKFNKKEIKDMYFERISTGFPSLDQVLGGGIAPGFTVLGAVSNLGKSTFVLQLAENVAKLGIPVLFYSMEMNATRIASKAISRRIFVNKATYEDDSITADNLLSQEYMSRITEDKWSEVQCAISDVQKALDNLYVVEGGEDMNTANHIVENVNAFIKKENVKPVVIVDYLQILQSENKSGIRADLDDNIRILKRLSNGNSDDGLEEGAGIPVIAISSINRTYYNKPLSMEGFKESGSIEYSSDVVLGLQFADVGREVDDGKGGKKEFDMNEAKAKFDRDVVIIPLKQRYGACGEPAAFTYYAKYDYFEDGIEKEKRKKKQDKNKIIVKEIKKEAIEKDNNSKLEIENKEVKKEGVIRPKKKTKTKIF